MISRFNLQQDARSLIRPAPDKVNVCANLRKNWRNPQNAKIFFNSIYRQSLRVGRFAVPRELFVKSEG